MKEAAMNPDNQLRHTREMNRVSAPRRLCFCAGLMAAILSLSGCGKGFYVSESEVAAYQAKLRTENDANALFSSLPITLNDLHVTFDSSGDVPHIRRTNALGILRNLPEMRLLEAHTYVHLARLSSQIEHEADAWIADKFSLLQQGMGAGIKPTLDQTNIHFSSSPVFSYDPGQNAVSVSSSVAISITGSLHVDVVGGITGFALSIVGGNPNGDYPLTINMDNFHLETRLQFFNPFRDAARVLVHVTPKPGTVTVTGSAPDKIKNGVRQAITTGLSSPIDADKMLLYDNFSLPQVTVAQRDSFSPTELKAGYLPRPHRADALLDVVLRGADGKYYHARKSAGNWGEFVAIPLPASMASDPSLTASGAGQLELAGITSQGQLEYAALRDGAWTNAYSISAGPTGSVAATFRKQKPAIVATAPGQVEIVAVGSDGKLYHARRVNGQWQSARAIQGAHARAQLPLRDPVAVLSGNKIWVFYADSRNQLFDVVYQTSTDTWRTGQEIPSARVRFAPAAASCGDGRIDLVYVKSDQTLAHRVARFDSSAVYILWTNETNLGLPRRWTSAPALTCSGYQQLDLLARDTTHHRLQHNHFVATMGPQGPVPDRRTEWQEWWTLVTDRFFGTLGFSGEVDGSFALGSTRSGDVELVAREEGTGARRIFENTYDADLFVTSPKAVHWGGWRPIGSQSFVGSPALAITDRELEIGSNWGATDIWRSALGDDNLPNFKDLPDSIVTVGIDPVVASSGPGSIDYFHLRNGGIEDIRLMNGVSVPTLLPDSRSITSPLAVQAFGNGQIEVVAVAADHTIHHWRRLDGVWQHPIKVPGTVVSAPILVHRGNGQLDLMAIGENLRLYRWRFLGEAWTNSYQIPSDFDLSPLLFGQSAASSWGDGTVDVVVVEDGSRKMFHARAVPGVVSLVFKEIGGQTTETPVLIAFGPQGLKVLASGTDGHLMENNAGPSDQLRRIWTLEEIQRGLNLSWQGFMPLTAARVLSGNVAKLGENELFLLVTDTSGRIYYNRFLHGGWKGFSSLPLQPSQVEHPPLFKPMAAVH